MRTKRGKQAKIQSRHRSLTLWGNHRFQATGKRLLASNMSQMKGQFRCIRNLTSNALKFTPREGKVTISASQEGDKTLISVSDTGVGMNQEQLDKIFQLKGTPSQYGTDGERGLGLGLQLVKEFTQLNQGELTIQSEEGKWSTFSFSLPSKA